MSDNREDLQAPLIPEEDIQVVEEDAVAVPTTTTTDPTTLPPGAEVKQPPTAQTMRVHPVVEAMEAGPTHVTHRWRDDLCDCCINGVFQPSCCFAWCCPLSKFLVHYSY